MESQELRVVEDQNLKRPKKDSVLQLFAEFYGLETVHNYKEVLRYKLGLTTDTCY